jgi:hypothetical protein
MNIKYRLSSEELSNYMEKQYVDQNCSKKSRLSSAGTNKNNLGS